MENCLFFPQMVLEYEPVLHDHLKNIEGIPYKSLAVLQLRENILKAESVAADPIPAVAEKLGLKELVKNVIKAGLKDTLESAGEFIPPVLRS